MVGEGEGTRGGRERRREGESRGREEARMLHRHEAIHMAWTRCITGNPSKAG